MLESIINNLELYFPTVAKCMTAYRQIDDFEIMAYTDDGDRYVYDDLNRTIRMLPRYEDTMTESVWRREFGIRLKHRMIRRGLTQQELANEVGISQVMLSNYMTGRSMPSFYIVDKLARALDCSVDDLRDLDHTE